MKWLPIKIVDQIESIKEKYIETGIYHELDIKSSLYFEINKISKSFSISIEFFTENMENDILEMTTVDLSYNEFIIYLTRLFYYHPKIYICVHHDMGCDACYYEEEACEIYYV